MLVSNLNRDFHTDINPQSLLREPIEAPHIKDITRSVVLLGGSNLSNTAPYITAPWDIKSSISHGGDWSCLEVASNPS